MTCGRFPAAQIAAEGMASVGAGIGLSASGGDIWS